MAQIKLYATIGDEVREFTEAEYAQHEKDLAKVAKDAETLATAQAEKEATRAAVLTRLGLSSDELLALLS